MAIIDPPAGPRKQHAGSDADRMQHFAELTREEQADVVRRMAADGVSEYSIASATKLSVEMVRTIIGGAGIVSAQP